MKQGLDVEDDSKTYSQSSSVGTTLLLMHTLLTVPQLKRYILLKCRPVEVFLQCTFTMYPFCSSAHFKFHSIFGFMDQGKNLPCRREIKPLLDSDMLVIAQKDHDELEHCKDFQGPLLLVPYISCPLLLYPCSLHSLLGIFMWVSHKNFLYAN